ncbi:MAG: GNAT family N-acetyltransferase [Mesorhizobium sp.]|nr:MAG: GNAT family N-acetyltransferase [Mesorhizobium sp.]
MSSSLHLAVPKPLRSFSGPSTWSVGQLHHFRALANRGNLRRPRREDGSLEGLQPTPKGTSMHAMLKTLSRFDRARVANLELEPEQEQFVDPLDFVFSELQGNARPDLEHPFAVVVHHQIVGFFVLREKAALPEWAPPGVITMHSFRVGLGYQGNGYGKAATGLVSHWISANRPSAKRLMLAVEENNARARHFYLTAGFFDTGATYYDEKFGLQNVLEREIESV